MNKFNINFFEFSFLVEACIPPVPIARGMFWNKVIDEYYDILSSEERKNLFEWTIRSAKFDLKNEDCKLFFNRYNPDNQYEVITNHQDVQKIIPCFLQEGKYHTRKNVSLLEEFIINIKKIE